MKAMLSIILVMNWACEKKVDAPAHKMEVSASIPASMGIPLLSSKNRVQRKRAEIVRNTIAKSLNLDPNGMCLELGKLPCANVVHKVSLGGMDPYGNSQYKRPTRISATSPIALERVVLSACIQRAGLDSINPSNGLIFKDLETSADGRLVNNEKIDESIQRLYQRAYMRNATTAEVLAVKDLYEQIFKENPIGAAQNWMILSCFSILSSVEMIFF